MSLTISLRKIEDFEQRYDTDKSFRATINTQAKKLGLSGRQIYDAFLEHFEAKIGGQ